MERSSRSLLVLIFGAMLALVLVLSGHVGRSTDVALAQGGIFPTATDTGATPQGTGTPPTITPTRTPFPTVILTRTPTLSPTATVLLSDLWVVVSASPDPVPSGQLLNFVVTVGNAGPGVSPATQLIAEIPSGTTVGNTGPCTIGPIDLSCPIPPMSPGTSFSFSISFRVVAANGTIFTTFDVDPDNLVQESNESNNTATVISHVAATATPTLTRTAT